MNIKPPTKKIFIVGYPRSGTTFFYNKLCAATAIKPRPETHIYNYSSTPIFLEQLRGHIFGYNISRMTSKNFRFRDLCAVVPAISQLGSKKKRSEMIEAIFSCAATRGIMIEKTPAHSKYISEIMTDFPDAYIVYLRRNPIDTINSCLQVNWTHNNTQRHAIEWAVDLKDFRKKQKISPEKMIEIDFDAFKSSPDLEIGKLLDLIEETPKGDIISLQDSVPDWERSWKETAKSSNVIEKPYVESLTEQNKKEIIEITQGPISLQVLHRVMKYRIRLFIYKYLTGRKQGEENRHLKS